MNMTLPAAPTPAIAAGPNPATKYRSMRKYSVWKNIPAAIGTAICTMFLAIEPSVKSFTLPPSGQPVFL